MIFKTCPYCGANLDPEEICDCPKAQMEHLGNLFNQYESTDISVVGMAGMIEQARKAAEQLEES